MEAHFKSLARWNVHSLTTEILCAIAKFLDDFEILYQDGLIPLAKLVDYLTEIDTMAAANAQSMSRLLQKFGLILESKRPRVPITYGTSSYFVQQTSVRINKEKLKKMVHPRHLKELTF